MGKIEIIIVSGGYPVVEMNGQYLEMKGGHLSKLREEMSRVIKTTPGFQTIRSISAWGGKITRTEASSPTLKQVIPFKEIVLHETDENTCDHHLIDKIRPALALLVWEKSEHFAQVGTTQTFECSVCGKIHFGVKKNILMRENTLFPPDFCTHNQCYSHTIQKMIDPEYVTKKE